MGKLKKIGLGGGCHWCTEGVFVSLIGVERVEQGWISSVAPNDAFSEAVIVHYDPDRISAVSLLDVHLRTHAAIKVHGLRHKYRSAVYYFDVSDRAQLTDLLILAGNEFAEPIITRVLPFVAFKPSLPEHRDYYRTDPGRPFCVRFIAPKLDFLRGYRGGVVR
ncbi:peptide-methionine (S)-S-oxide reductase [Neolewinella antarctica]|uniref:peptide-methionine (S)-S-oxide reductase n=1 Tax=Neolewinella antarctica TaxID=442734 RepID=A0ABX0X6M1_9BACT|nr:peptide-methionine (S)-S-oxide reductase [Neolewinella antarctica]NJC24659.1 peptide-methionine (S)-S-oxide reductase [Neolewinella antarctica]